MTLDASKALEDELPVEKEGPESSASSSDWEPDDGVRQVAVAGVVRSLVQQEAVPTAQALDGEEKTALLTQGLIEH